MNLLPGVHHKRAARRDGLVNGFSGQNQQFGIGRRGHHAQRRALPLHQGGGCWTQVVLLSLCANPGLAAPNKHDTVMPVAELHFEGLVHGLDLDIPEIHRRKGLGRALNAAKLARDHAHDAVVGPVGADGHDGNVLGENGLVARGVHLVLRREIEPQLAHLEGAALGRKLVRVKLCRVQAT